MDVYYRLKGSNVEEMTEAVHVTCAICGGASLVHGVQMRNVAEKRRGDDCEKKPQIISHPGRSETRYCRAETWVTV